MPARPSDPRSAQARLKRTTKEGAGGDGIRLATDLTSADTDLAVVLVSGFSPARFDLGSVSFRHQFLSKPFTLQALASCLEAALPGVIQAQLPPEVK